MPLLIRELHIKVNLNAPSPGQGAAQANAATGGSNASKKEAGLNENRDALSAECVEQVLEILKVQNEP